MTFDVIVIDDEMHAIGELCELIEMIPHLRLKKTFLDSTEALTYLMAGNKVDIIFSDIRMPGLTGLEAAKLFQRYCRFLVFVTAYREYSLQAFDEQATGYLLKPVDFISLSELVNSFLARDRALITTLSHTKNDVLFVKTGDANNYQNIEIDDIYCIKADTNYFRIFTKDKSHMVHGSLVNVERKLESTQQFVRINKSIIVSIIHVSSVNGNTVVLKNAEEFIIGGKMYKTAFFSMMKKRSFDF